jgi:hypothetical protein
MAMHRLVAMTFALYLMTSATAQTDATGVAIDNATHALLRVNYCVFGGPPVDIYLDGEVAVINDRAQINMQPLAVWGYWHLEPGAYSVAVAPGGAGHSVEGTFMQPVDVTLEAGHRYTVVVLGQADEPSHEALVIDETMAFEEIGATPTDTAHITVNNVRGASGVTFELDGTVREENVPYGGFRAAIWPRGPFTGLDLTLRDATNGILVSDAFTEEAWNLPGGDSTDCVGGTVGSGGQAWYNQTSGYTTSLSVLDFLEGVASTDGSPVSFDIFLSAIEAAGLEETLATGGPHLIYVPTDAAFSRLPQDQRDAMMADRQALADVARHHISEGYYPVGSFRDPNDPDRATFTNLLGTELVRRNNAIDRVPYELLETVSTSSGSRLLVINTVLIPRAR